MWSFWPACESLVLYIYKCMIAWTGTCFVAVKININNILLEITFHNKVCNVSKLRIVLTLNKQLSISLQQHLIIKETWIWKSYGEDINSKPLACVPACAQSLFKRLYVHCINNLLINKWEASPYLFLHHLRYRE